MSKTPLQTIINPSSDSTLNVYATNAQNVPVISSANVVITNTNQYVTEIYNLKAAAAGNIGELEFNDGNGLAADTGLTYDAATDSLHVSGNVFTGNLRTDHLFYSNGTAYTFSGSSYGNGNVASYLPTYNGIVTASTVVSSGHSNAATFNGSGAGLTNLPAANVVGTVANANYALYSYQAWGIDGSNVSGYVPDATHATIANTANAVAGANVSGAVASATNATTATTVTANAQPNITTVGTLSSLSVTANTSVGNLTVNGNANVSRLTATSLVNLGAIGNITITGGTNGQSLITDGAGHLSWSTVSGGSSSTPTLQQVTSSGSETDQQVHITNSTAATGFNSGALKVQGGVGVVGDIFTGGRVAARDSVYAGQYASYSSFTVPKFFGRDAGAAYIQGALQNTNEVGSADWVAYGDQSDDSNGWADFGFTGSVFDDPDYAITQPSDGYFIVQGMPGQGGNLILATGDLGNATHRDIIFATGGFAIEDERMRLNHEDSTLYIGQHGDGREGVTNLDVNGNVTMRSDLTMNASHAELVFGDASATGNPGMSSTGVFSIVANKDVSEKQWVFNTDGSLSVPGTIFPTSNVAYDLGSDTQRFRDLYLSGEAIIKNQNEHGGAGFAGMMTLENTTATNGKKFIRIDSAGKLQIINDAYTDTIFDLADNGDIIVTGNIMPTGNVAKDIGSDTHRFKDLYLSGTTIHLGGTLIQAQANGEVSIGNATFSSSGTISAADISLTVSALSANSVAALSDVGKMLTYDGISPITYGIPNNATTAFATGSRIELLALSQAAIIVQADGGSGVTLITSKDLNTNDPTISNIQSAKLTKIGTDTWYLGL